MRAGLTGLATLRRRLAALPARARAEATLAMRAIGEDMLDRARERLLSGGATRSTPGEAPADLKGNLAASLAATVDAETGRLMVGSCSRHARDLEYGTRRMAARPFLRPAIAAGREAAQAHARTALATAAGAEEAS